MQEPTNVRRKSLRYLATAAAVALGIGVLTHAVPLTPHTAVSGAMQQATATETPATPDQDTEPAVEVDEETRGGGSTNRVTLVNHTDGRLRVKGRIQLSHSPGDRATPENEARATGSCRECETFAVALQIALIARTASTIAPVNQAVALNDHCSHCLTVAIALQYVVQVDDPAVVPDEVADLVQSMQAEMQAIAHDRRQTLSQAETRLDAVINRFQTLALSLYRTRDQAMADAAPSTPTPGASASPTPTPDPVTPSPVPATPTPSAAAVLGQPRRFSACGACPPQAVYKFAGHESRGGALLAAAA